MPEREAVGERMCENELLALCQRTCDATWGVDRQERTSSFSPRVASSAHNKVLRPARMSCSVWTWIHDTAVVHFLSPGSLNSSSHQLPRHFFTSDVCALGSPASFGTAAAC